MSTIRGGIEQSRERLVALVLLLQRAFQYGPITQEEILRDLKIDEYPVAAKGPRKIRAYEGAESTVRQKFERDKARIRELGFDIETVSKDDGSVGYRIDPASGYAPLIYFTPEEERVVKLALSFCGFGKSGAFSVFNDVPASDGGLAASNYYTPVLRALHLRRALAFEYLSAANKARLVEPLVIDVFDGATYLVARVKDTREIKGYRFTRMTSMPVVLPDTFEVDDDTVSVARAWRPEYAKSPRPLDVVVSTNENYAELLVRQYPNAMSATRSDGTVEVGVTFQSPRAALRLLLDSADRVRLQSPKSLKNELTAWLKEVNRGKAPDAASLSFDVMPSNDVLGQTLQLLHAVYVSDDGLRISELAKRFSLSPEHVRLIMDRLVSLEPMAESTDGTDTFPAHVIKECDDWDDEANDDSTYRADFSDLPEGAEDPSPFMWRDLFELNIALREASRIYTDDAIFSAIEKIEDATRVPVQIEMASNEALLAQVESAIESHSQIKIEYTSGVSDESHVRAIEPREMKVLNGHTYVRAYCTSRTAWRTFRVDRINDVLATSPAPATRPLDTVANWLTQVGEEGDEIVVVVEAANRWLFEPLPGARWLRLDDGRHAVKFRVSDEQFVDHLMLRAGAGAVVATARYAKAGHELAKRIAAQL
ncbi:MAG TPA: WYL domain-containing protein [Acidimicrobiales bacterium]|nr:WYL domain-containing protein [Acidimicrobiales bacterium]